MEFICTVHKNKQCSLYLTAQCGRIQTGGE